MSNYYTVEFRIYGDVLDFDQISRNLGLVSTSLQTKGERVSADKKFTKSMWGYDQTEEGKGAKEWPSLENGIQSLLEELVPLKEKIRAYQKRNKTVLWCGHFHDTFGSGPTFSTRLLKEMSDLGLEVDLSTYFYSNED